jgi:YD repeat-containing protein
VGVTGLRTSLSHRERWLQTSTDWPSGPISGGAQGGHLAGEAGNLVSTTDRDGRKRVMTYDGDNRLLTETWIAADGVTVDNHLSYSYDENGNILTASSNAGTYTMTYDGDNRPLTRTDPNGITQTFTYDENGPTRGKTGHPRLFPALSMNSQSLAGLGCC